MGNEELEELKNVRKLLMLLLFKIGANSDEISSALNVTPSRVRHIMSSSGIKLAQVECQGAK